MQMYIQWRKYAGSTSSSQTLIMMSLPRFEKLALSQFQLYIESQTMTQYFVCRTCKKNISIQAAAIKGKVFCIVHMLRIHTGLRKWSKKTLFDLHLKKMKPFGIHEPCIKIANNELLFEKYRMALNRDKYEIEVQNDNARKRNQTLFDFMQGTFN